MTREQALNDELNKQLEKYDGRQLLKKSVTLLKLVKLVEFSSRGISISIRVIPNYSFYS